MKSMLLLVFLSLSLDLKACLAPEGRRDLLAILLSGSSECPHDVRELKRILSEDGLRSLPAMVANRGRHNPELGSFSIFESVKGESRVLRGQSVLPEHLYFGHFTHLDPNAAVALAQKSAPGKLLIEVIAYDFQKKFYNFYELIGTQAGPKWFYRGDSLDALEDNRLLKLGRAPQVGTKMRCSACHNSGGPIMKELAAPHNDWWTKERRLSFGSHQPDLELASYLHEFIDAGEFAVTVKAGMSLVAKKNLPRGRSLQEKLRPLFCTTEINLVSDLKPLTHPRSFIEVPTAVIADPLLVGETRFALRKDLYLSALRRLNFRFPETDEVDGDHAFLAPVRGEVNHQQVLALIRDGIIDEEFALDVLSIDFQNPLFSASRCDLLRFVPESGTLVRGLITNLKNAPTAAAKLLAERLMNRDGRAHRERALTYLQERVMAFSTQEGVVRELRSLDHLRESVFKDEISKNPRGQILEPGFRVIFPQRRGLN